MRDRLRVARRVVALVAVGLLAACGPDASSAPSTSVPSSQASTGASTGTDDTVVDFGSAYVGQPVAFWFWAPY